jgi:hypothetical protein
MAQSKKPKLVPPALTVKVTCTAGHKLSGLFVIFKLVPPEGESKEQKLVRILEATPHPGDPPVEPAALTDEQKKDPSTKATYDAAKKQYGKDKKAWDEAKALYDAALDKDTPPDPGDQFVLGIVNHKGYLVPVHTAYNPWYDVVTTPGRDPDAYKLLAGEKYQVCLLRHPGPAVARALTRYLNKKPDADDAKYSFGGWGTLTRTVEIAAAAASGGSEVALKLSEDAADYVPRGGDRYGNWTIYRAMPHRYCPGLAPHVEKVQKDLGLLRYPVGGSGSPFDALAFSPNGDAEKKEEGGLDRQAQAAAARFQENVNEGRAVVLTYKDLAHGGKDWAFVLGKPFDAATAAEDAKWSKLSHPSFMLGLIDAETAARIEHWIGHGLRKPDEVLIPSLLGYGIWMLERGELALSSWSLLAETFGCQYGVKPGSSLRSVRVFAWDGAINNSVHKTGLAVDMSGGADRHPSAAWPIRYEAHWTKDERKAKSELAAAEKAVETAKADLEKKKLKGDTAAIAAADEAVKKAELRVQRQKEDESDSKFNWRIKWRVYGHSDFDVFNVAKRDAEVARLRSAIAAHAGLPDPEAPPADPAAAPPPASPPRGKLWKAFKDKKLKGVDGADVEAWLDERLKPFVEYARTLLAMTADALIASYFRYEVTQFIPNPYESDGGTSLRKYKPTEGDGEYPAKSWARSWVNLTALGYPCQMERIGPHSMDFRDQVWVRGKDHKKAQFKTWSMAGYFTVTSDEDSDFVLMLSDITASEADAPQLKQRDTDIPIVRGSATVATYKPAELDGKLIKDWKAAALKLDASLRPRGGKGSAPADAHGAQIAMVLSATDKGKEKVQAAVDLLGGQFAGKSFVVMHAGDLARVDVGAGEIVTGKALAEKLEKGMADFEAQATANAKKKADEAAQKAADEQAAKDKAAADAAAADKPPPRPPVKTRTQIASEKKAAEKAAADEAKKLTTDWAVVIQPIFAKTPDAANLTFLPEDSVVLPPGSDGGHLEWWHYQHRSAGPTWGALLEECGYSLKVMTVPLEGNAAPEGTPVHLGLGYTQDEVGSSPGAFNEGAVENSDPAIPPGG